MNILLTGATGFVGSWLARELSVRPGFSLTCAVRRPDTSTPGKAVTIGELGAGTSYKAALDSQEVVIHTAARAHVMNEEVSDPLAEYRRVNVEGTLNLARQAVSAGVRRFVFISSIKVNGEHTDGRPPFAPSDHAEPEDPYGISKHEAEIELRKLGAETGMDVVIIRPPLVYGPGVKGNFASMINLVGRGVPLPLGSVNNKRSLVALDNLVDLIITCIDHPAAANQVFLVSDGHDLSTTELLRGVGDAMGKPARLVPVPAGLLMFAASALGRKAVAQRLLGSLQVDIAKARDLLGWEPPLSVEEGLRRCFVSGE